MWLVCLPRTLRAATLVVAGPKGTGEAMESLVGALRGRPPSRVAVLAAGAAVAAESMPESSIPATAGVAEARAASLAAAGAAAVQARLRATFRSARMDLAAPVGLALPVSRPSTTRRH